MLPYSIDDAINDPLTCSVEGTSYFAAYEADPVYLSLTAAVDAAPDEDLPKLVRADWIEERGDWLRAAGIRLWVGLRTREVMIPFRAAIAEVDQAEHNAAAVTAANGP